MDNNCKNCKNNYGTYHCLDCDLYDGNLEELETFCGYCNHTQGSDQCNNCAWNEVIKKD